MTTGEKLKYTHTQVYPFFRGALAAIAGFAAGLFIVFAMVYIKNNQTVNAGEITQNRETARRTEEDFLARRIIQVLEPFVGENRVRAEVRLDIDYDTVTTNEEIFDPDGQVLQAYTIQANLASQAEYEINKYHRQVIQNGGRIKKMSVLILIDGLWDGRAYRELSAAERFRLADIIAPVIGFEAHRGDVLQIENVRFYSTSGLSFFEWAEILLLIVCGAALIALWRKTAWQTQKKISCNKKEPINIIWQKLQNADDNMLANLLIKEGPACAAYVLSQLKKEKAARVMENFPLSFAAETASFMAENQPVSQMIVDTVEQALQQYFTQDNTPDNELEALLSSLKPQRRRELLAAVEKQNIDLAAKLQEKIFNFEDFNEVENKDIQRLFDEVEAEDLAVALRGASEKLKQRFFMNMPPAAEEFIKKKMLSLGPIKLKDVENAQDQIIAQAENLATNGKIRLPKINKEYRQ